MPRINFEERLAALKAKRAARTITSAERRELEKLEERVRTLVEWVAEPTDEHGDIIDPVFGKTRPDVDSPLHLTHFPAAAYVDIARVVTKGSDAEGMTERVYDYRVRYYRDGRMVQLTTNDAGDAPIEVTP